MLECPDRYGRATADARLLVDVLHVVVDGLGGDAEAVHCPPVLKITQCVLIRLENFLFYLILQGLPKFVF